MRAFTYSVHVDRPPDAVWRFLTDLSQSSRWRTTVKSMEVAGGGPLVAGARLRVVQESLGRVSDRVIDVAVFEPPRRWVTHSASNGLSGEFEYRVAPEGTGTRVTATCDLKAHRVLAWLFLPLIARSERRARANQMQTFKQVCEALPAGGSQLESSLSRA